MQNMTNWKPSKTTGGVQCYSGSGSSSALPSARGDGTIPFPPRCVARHLSLTRVICCTPLAAYACTHARVFLYAPGLGGGAFAAQYVCFVCGGRLVMEYVLDPAHAKERDDNVALARRLEQIADQVTCLPCGVTTCRTTWECGITCLRFVAVFGALRVTPV
jgi:hypothetical protein